MEKKSEEDARKPFLYRYFAKIPEAGKFVFLDSAGWMRLTAASLQDELSEMEYDERLESVRRFERQLTDNGYLVVKLFLTFPKRNRRSGSDHLKMRRIQRGGSARKIYGRISIMTNAWMHFLLI